jgi:hypothetical protein
MRLADKSLPQFELPGWLLQLSIFLASVGGLCAVLAFIVAECLAVSVFNHQEMSCLHELQICRHFSLTPQTGNTALRLFVWAALISWLVPFGVLVAQGQIAGWRMEPDNRASWNTPSRTKPRDPRPL